jgi:hypothetical protein
LVPKNKQAIAQDLAKEVLQYSTVPAFPETALKKVVLQGVREALAVSPPLLHGQQQTSLQTRPAT